MDRRAAPRIAGRVPDWRVLPGNLRGTQRIVLITPGRERHIRQRRPEWAGFCLGHLSEVLADPQFIGYRPHTHPRQVEFVRDVAEGGKLFLVSLKFLDERDEAWVNTAYPLERRHLTRRQRNGTLWRVGRGP